ncbi:hypothetical protein cypCar_00000072, partial [Cyprinus carpio]
ESLCAFVRCPSFFMISQGSRKKLLCLHAMPPGKRLLVVLLALHWSARGSAVTDASTETHPQCDTDGSTVRCTLEQTHLMSPDPITLDFTEGQTVEIYSACQQNGSDGLKCLCQRINTSTHALLHTERFGNETYTVICGNHSVTAVRSPQRWPSVPVLKAIAKAGSTNIAQLVCTSEGNPKPAIMWYGNRNNPKEGMKNKRYKTESIVTSDDDYNGSSDLRCCANLKVDGQKAQTIFLKSGQSLLLRCAITSMDAPELRWYFNNTAVKGITSLYFINWTEYFFIESVNMTHSGEYICESKNKQTRKTHVRVLENYKIDILQLNENNNIPARKKASFCFQALVFSYPKAQCHWITPNQTKIQCRETHYHNFNSTFELCNPEPGQYQMKLKNQYYSVIRNMSLCISDDPKIAIKLDKDSNVSCETESSLPMNVSWKICPSHTNCNKEGWKEMPVVQPKVMDSDQFCQKKIYFARPRWNSEDHFMKCCISNKAGTECSDQIRLSAIFPSIDYVICFLVIFILLVIIFGLIVFIRVKKQYIKIVQHHGEYTEPDNNLYVHMTPSTKGQENEALLRPSISSVSTIEEMLECEDKHQEEELQSLTYDDLLSFSFQVAKGMEFLSSKNLYYNVGGFCHNDITYQNAPVTPDATLMEKMDVFQYDTENSDESKAVDNPGSVGTEPLI